MALYSIQKEVITENLGSLKEALDKKLNTEPDAVGILSLPSVSNKDETAYDGLNLPISRINSKTSEDNYESTSSKESSVNGDYSEEARVLSNLISYLSMNQNRNRTAKSLPMV